ncbi:DUF4124 domain-containing protein [Methylophilus medardicus]|uniref:DUF4124 domain-containing protein n=1 Tax=Methylophilus medardicus TaxID=2588534 RepID=A0A5B8CV17_9PROT|nr:DUF4124 domain-containing protein [Methylophilus medardicus]QDC45148.1 DUF4124 domain-containing protein [Methylophilus medardicus]QDC50155.1 DUF4124 domain-containing protein [Methylophilus medardicus]QDC53860.1 DUF4124 domain-containing protein [Methylophilus medardicus]
MKRLFYILAFTMVSHNSLADIYKYTDSNGVTTYTNIKPEGNSKAELVISGPKTADPAPPPREKKSTVRAPSPNSFPKVDQQTQTQRDQKRKEVLMAELAQEKQALENAKQLYEEAQNTPEVYRGANGKTFRNVAKYEEKLHLIEAEIQAHERNIELLNKELHL